MTICGSAVGNPANTLQYLQLGLRSFSVSPQNLIEVEKSADERENKAKGRHAPSLLYMWK
ncbi:MAG: hypothetical protein ACLVJH_04585 [Faecalibacterium prausnitzii]